MGTVESSLFVIACNFIHYLLCYCKSNCGVNNGYAGVWWQFYTGEGWEGGRKEGLAEVTGARLQSRPSCLCVWWWLGVTGRDR